MSAERTSLFRASITHLVPALRAQAFKAHRPHTRCIKVKRKLSIVRNASEKDEEGSASAKETNTYWETMNALNSILTDGDTETEPNAAVKNEGEYVNALSR